MTKMKYDRAIRILDIYLNLRNGGQLNKHDAAVKYSVSEKTIQRDIEDMRVFLEESQNITVKYCKASNAYSFVNNGE